MRKCKWKCKFAIPGARSAATSWRLILPSTRNPQFSQSDRANRGEAAARPELRVCFFSTLSCDDDYDDVTDFITSGQNRTELRFHFHFEREPGAEMECSPVDSFKAVNLSAQICDRLIKGGVVSRQCATIEVSWADSSYGATARLIHPPDWTGIEWMAESPSQLELEWEYIHSFTELAGCIRSHYNCIQSNDPMRPSLARRCERNNNNDNLARSSKKLATAHPELGFLVPTRTQPPHPHQCYTHSDNNNLPQLQTTTLFICCCLCMCMCFMCLFWLVDWPSLERPAVWSRRSTTKVNYTNLERRATKRSQLNSK